ncbi:MAG: M23 family metallopeptidase [Acidiferrobacterales bacterium]|nr:M23 family metallopeptidase [Acidiferrobacterales bacterium]
MTESLIDDDLTITISDAYGSKFYQTKRSFKWKLILAGVAMIGIVAVSVFGNVWQLNEQKSLTATNSALEAEIIQFDSANSNLNQVISSKSEVIERISNELVKIERNSGVETADKELELDERIKLIADYYSDKDAEFSEIGNRVQQIEGLIGLSDEDKEASNLVARVELASLTAAHEKILHDSIPNGYPIESRVVTSKFGSRIHPITKVKSFHKGVDIRAKTPKPIYATADGIVRAADYSKLSGNRIVVQHNFGFETRYSHLDSMDVEPGDIVHKGDLLGASGNTGLSDAPHLHYEIRYLGKSIDPDQFLKWEFGSHEIFTNVRGIKWPSLISLINKQITHQTLQLSQLEPTSLVK